MRSIKDFLQMNEAEEFDLIANKILNGTSLIVRGPARDHEFRIIEIEFYLHSAEHPDPFVHQSADQLDVGRWYFHKTGGSYRGGTFKGLDITFALGKYGGILIRSLEQLGGELVEGPSLCVDKILEMSEFPSVASLADAVDHVDAWVWSENSPIYLKEIPGEIHEIYTSARVGLNINKSPDFAAMPYRYISASRIKSIKKSRTSVVAGLREFHGLTAEEIKKIYKK